LSATTTASPVLIILTDRVRAELESLARARKTPLRSVQRACIVLAGAAGDCNAQIARDLGICVHTVRTWRGRFAVERMREAWPTAELVHLPVHASWQNQLESYSAQRHDPPKN
jgi:FixJ family two-component response regulator